MILRNKNQPGRSMETTASRLGFAPVVRDAGPPIQFMQSSISNLKHATTWAIPGLMMAVLLAGCSDTPRWGGWSTAPTRAQIETGLQQLNTYVYYPRYQVYFNSGRGRYTFWDGRVWVTGPNPPKGIPVELLEASPSVAMRFEDAPEWHHAEVSRLYPRNWVSAKTDLASVE